MRIDRVTAQAFGPFRGEKLELAPGLNVVWGLNEAGKSTWHSALQLTITGLRRGKGRPTKEEQVVIDRRRPWSGDHWRLEGELSLDNNEQLVVTWDLNNKVAKVLDLLGRDRSNEWMSEGACDLSRIVGLDRNSFLATACVRQSDLQGVHDNPALLQDLLQKAAASASADSTASSAIERIDGFFQEHVGLDRSNSSKPLVTAKRQLEVARQALAKAQEAHRERLDLLQTISTQREALSVLRLQSEALDVAIRLTSARAVQSDRLANRHAIEEMEVELAATITEAQLHRQVVEVVDAALLVVDMRRIHDEARAHHNSADELTRVLSSMDAEISGICQQEELLLAARAYAERGRDLEHLQEAVKNAEDAQRSAGSALEAKEALARRLARLDLELAERSARRSAEALQRATVLHTRYPTAPSNPMAEDELAQRIHLLLDRWTNQPAMPVLSGATAAELEAELDALPEYPDGELVPAEEVLQAERDWHLASEVLRLHGEARPAEPDAVSVGASPTELREWAIVLESARQDPAALETDTESLKPRPGNSATSGLVAGVAVALVGVGLGVVVHPVLFLLVAAGVIVAVLANRSKMDGGDLDEIASPERRSAQVGSGVQAADDVIAELRRRALPGEAHELRELAYRVEMAQHRLADLQRWSEEDATLRAQLDRTAHQLQRCLLSRGVEVDGGADPMAIYRRQCDERSQQAVLASRRSSLTVELRHRRSQEELSEQISRTRRDLEAETTAIATAVGIAPEQPIERLLDAYRGWLETRSARQQMLQIAAEEWAELNLLLGGRPLAVLEATAAQDDELRRRCAERVSGAAGDEEDLGGLDRRDIEELKRLLQAELMEVTQTASRLSSSVPVDDPRLALSEAEAQSAAALAELRRMAGEHAKEFEVLSIGEIDNRLLACRNVRNQRQQERDEALGRARLLEESSPDLARCRQDLAEAEQALAGCCRERPAAAALVPLDSSRDELESLRVDHQDALARADVDAGKLRGGLAEREQALVSSENTDDEVAALEEELAALEPARLLGFDSGSVPAIDVLQRRRTRIVEDLDNLIAGVARLEGQLGEREENAADPAAAAEAHASAHLELQRVQTLAEVLATTKDLLKGAQERVHRDIAPRLNDSTNRWLPSLFGDRYTSVRIDPASLDVQVFSAGDPRRADLLSQGTAEQFYLLLRIALAETLTKASGESCPLILDDITVNFDSERKIAALELLQALASERQVVLFTQEDDVRTWAEQNLESADNFICLPGRAAI